EDERAEARRERHEDSGEDVMAEEDSSEQADRGWIQREERSRRAGQVLVSMLGDPQEEDAVPAGPDIGERAQVAGDGGVVPVVCQRVPVRLEDEEGEERGCPDRGAAPDEVLDGRAARRGPGGQLACLDAWLPQP